MPATNRPTKSSYEVHESVRVDTGDNEDHTFCGIMFPIKCREVLPLECIVVHTIAVRGQMGPMTVWVTNEQDEKPENGEYSFPLQPTSWTKIYEKTHAPSQRDYCELKLTEHPVVVKPGYVRVVYIHSTLNGDEAIVYDNSRMMGLRRNDNRPRYEDHMIKILSGKAHLACEPFGQVPIWGWGNAWRDHREFVGRIEYGAVYKLWNPEIYLKYGKHFSDVVKTMLLCQRRPSSPLSILPDECIFYILNMCHWSWFNDTLTDMDKRKRYRRRLKHRRELLEARKEVVDAMMMSSGDIALDDDDADDEFEPSEGNDDDDDDDLDDIVDEGIEGEIQDVEMESSQRAEADPNVVVEAASHDHNGTNGAEAGAAPAADEGGENGNQQEGENEDESDESEWERANGYRADTTVFAYQDESSDDDDDDDESDSDDDSEDSGEMEEETTETNNEQPAVGASTNNGDATNNWLLGRHMARVPVLEALAGMENNEEQHGTS